MEKPMHHYKWFDAWIGKDDFLSGTSVSRDQHRREVRPRSRTKRKTDRESEWPLACDPLLLRSFGIKDLAVDFSQIFEE
jgi:hypothetical protein